MNKKIILSIIGVVLVGTLVYQSFLKPEEAKLETAKVSKGLVIKQVSETGQVKKGESINLGFETGGTLEELYVKVGEEVEKGDVLAKLNNRQLMIQQEEAQASLQVANSQLTKLLLGPTKEEVQLAKTQVDNAQVSLNSAQQNLEDVREQAEENLDSAYEDALNVLEDAQLKISNSLNTVNVIQRAYFTASDQPGAKVRDEEDRIRNHLESAQEAVSLAQQNEEPVDIDQALDEVKSALQEVSASLKTIRETCEEPNYRDLVSSSYKESLDNHRSLITSALTTIVNTQQAIQSVKLSNQAQINQAESQVESAQGQLKAAKEELERITADPRQEDVDLYRAQVRQARAQVNLLNQKIQDTVLKAPIQGKITNIHKEEGEVTQSLAGEPVITLLPEVPFTVSVDIYEEDVALMRQGNPSQVSLISFPDQKLSCQVASIDPAEKVIEGVVYYEVTINCPQFPEGTKPGMTADIIVTTDSKENALFVPEDAIQKKDDKTFVEVLTDNREKKEREVQVGLQGSNDRVEIVSGLKKDEEVIIR